MEKHDFKLVGLGRQRSVTLEHLDNDRDTFWAVSALSPEKFNELWNFCKGNWKHETKIAEIECDGLSADGTPINGKLVGVRLLNH